MWFWFQTIILYPLQKAMQAFLGLFVKMEARHSMKTFLALDKDGDLFVLPMCEDVANAILKFIAGRPSFNPIALWEIKPQDFSNHGEHAQKLEKVHWK